MATVPRVSVVVPAFQNAVHLPTVASVLAQTYPDLELWLPTTAPRTALGRSCRSSATDPRIRLLRTPRAAGPCATGTG